MDVIITCLLRTRSAKELNQFEAAIESYLT